MVSVRERDTSCLWSCLVDDGFGPSILIGPQGLANSHGVQPELSRPSLHIQSVSEYPLLSSRLSNHFPVSVELWICINQQVDRSISNSNIIPRCAKLWAFLAFCHQSGLHCTQPFTASPALAQIGISPRERVLPVLSAFSFDRLPSTNYTQFRPAPCSSPSSRHIHHRLA
ncbi:hypothetical protein L211DRAFT_260175 [Terfezia boudieri ATCC MYA-4762]|uniref:Uncharacterized protein n=1 Tax=Terfezia boudieri ATCC MYA-4762 TaxID=1051890 RepID=A0A3N4M273_9PEZI|nr:hypothetical protein L211DRAFT_260175 [Terfezia boudieri ATCC MYA-4762]